MSDPVVAFPFVMFIGFLDGWYFLKYALYVVYRMRRRPAGWNTALALQLVLTVALSAVIYAIMTHEPALPNAYAYLPATFVGSSIVGGLSFITWGTYAASRNASRRRR